MNLNSKLWKYKYQNIKWELYLGMDHRKTDRVAFFLALEEEVINAKIEGKDVFIQMDVYSKLGPEVMKADPYGQSPNGKLLHNIMIRLN